MCLKHTAKLPPPFPPQGVCPSFPSREAASFRERHAVVPICEFATLRLVVDVEVFCMCLEGLRTVHLYVSHLSSYPAIVEHQIAVLSIAFQNKRHVAAVRAKIFQINKSASVLWSPSVPPVLPHTHTLSRSLSFYISVSQPHWGELTHEVFVRSVCVSWLISCGLLTDVLPTLVGAHVT